MKRYLAMCAVAVASLAWASPTPAEVTSSVDIHVRIGDAPPPPAVVFASPPQVVVVPGTTVYYVGDDCDYDVFRYGRRWYVFHDGWWYRAKHYRGPFTVVETRYVPRAVINVPGSYWRHPHGGPPGLTKKNVVVVKEGKHRHGHGPKHDDD